MLTAGPEAGTLEEHRERDHVERREPGPPVAFRFSPGPDAARQGGEVLGADHHGRTVDEAGAGDDSVGGDVAPDECAELTERALVEKVLEAHAGIELALAMVLGQPL